MPAQTYEASIKSGGFTSICNEQQHPPQTNQGIGGWFWNHVDDTIELRDTSESTVAGGEIDPIVLKLLDTQPSNNLLIDSRGKSGEVGISHTAECRR
jgi:hypothetical protein